MTVPMGDLFSDFMKMLVLSTAMSVSSFVCGLIPFSIQSSGRYLRYISLMSMGLLLSTSLILIIPEGIEAVFDVSDREKAPKMVGLLILAGFLMMYIIEHIHLLVHMVSSNVKYIGIQPDVEQQESHSTSLEVTNGILQKYLFSPLLKITRPLSTSPVTLGLVIHSITDGIVLTSSIFSSNESLNFIMFVAIFVHKLPTSFSLSSILIAEGFPKSTVKLHLFIFSSSLMVGSLFSFIIFQMLSGSNKSNADPAVAYLLMFSGGTFLYIGVHTMIEILGGGHESHLPQPPGSSSSEETIVVPQVSESDLTLSEFGITILGFLLPLIALLFDE